METQLAAAADTSQWYVTHATLARGIAGERLVARTAGGTTTVHTAGHDIVLKDGALLEVKSSKISTSGSTAKWQWNKILGERGRKAFDFLVLIGQADARYAHLYRYPGPNVVFIVPWDDVTAVCGGRDKSGIAKISLTPNPRSARGLAAGLFEYQVAPANLNDVVDNLR